MSNRVEERRQIYIGEDISCTMTCRGRAIDADVLDLSQGGMAFSACNQRENIYFNNGDLVTAEFHRRDGTTFSVQGCIKYRKTTQIRGRSVQRYGLEFALRHYSEYVLFTEDLSVGHHHCRTSLRPQVACRDPFFFEEVLLFIVNGFTPEGLDLVVSSRCKTLLPNLPLSLDLFIPGRGVFKVDVVVDNMQYRSDSLDRFRFFARYVHASEAYHEAVSEYLLMFARNVTANQLADQGYRLGNLDHAIQVVRDDDAEIRMQEFLPSMMAIPAPEDSDVFQGSARKILCKVGPCPAASCRLIFVEGKTERSELMSLGHQLPNYLIHEGHLEVSKFLISQHVGLRYVFIPLLKHIVRIAVQSEVKNIVIESAPQMLPLFRYLGFKPLQSRCSRQVGQDKIELHLLTLAVDHAISNANFSIPRVAWKNVYHALHDFFKDKTKQLAPGKVYIPMGPEKSTKAAKKRRAAS